MRNKALISLLLCLLVASVCAAQMKLVKLKSGGQVRGEVTETDDGYRVQTSMGVLIYSKDQVLSIEDVQDPKAEYKQRLAEADPKDADAMTALGEWALEAKMLEEAKAALETALKAKPDHVKAKLLLRQVTARLAAKEPTTEPAEGSGSDEDLVRSKLDPKWLVPMEDIYRIRSFELHEKDRVVIRFKDGVIDYFMRQMAGRDKFDQPHADRWFLRQDNVFKARYMLKWMERDETVRDGIIVRTDPRFMIDFRSSIWPMLSQYCTVGGCPDGKLFGKVRVFRFAGSNVRVDYTNFLMLVGYEDEKGRRMVDRDRVEDSLLLDYGLPEGQSRVPRPAALKKVRPLYTGRNDPRYKRVEQWIRSLHPAPQPDYGLQYKPPFGIKLHLGGGPQLPPREEPQLPPRETQPAEEKPI